MGLIIDWQNPGGVADSWRLPGRRSETKHLAKPDVIVVDLSPPLINISSLTLLFLSNFCTL